MIAALALALLPLAAPAEAPKYDMTTFTLVLVRPGDVSHQLPAPTLGVMRERHEALLQELIKHGKVVAWGAVENPTDLLEVIVLDVADPAEAKRLLAGDPWLRSGRRVAEMHPWMAARGILQPRGPGTPVERVTFGLLRRPADAPSYPEEKLKEIQKGHMANIEAMAATGDLVIAGPLKDDGALRGVFVFRGTDEKHLREIAAPDAAIQAGRLALDLHVWAVPEGTLPAKK